MRYAWVVLGMLVAGCASVVEPESAASPDAADAAGDAAWQGAWCFHESANGDFVCFERGEPGRANCELDRLRHVQDGADDSCAPGTP